MIAEDGGDASRPDGDAVEDIAEEYLEALLAGEFPDRQRLIDEHPHLAGELARRLALIERLRGAIPQSPATGICTEPGRIRCPHCGQIVELAGGPQSEIDCPNCGDSFSVDTRSLQQGEDVQPPESIGKFEILELVGRGAFGFVYRARDRELSRIVAVKVPRRGSLGSEAEEARFLREARSSAKLKHVGIVAVLEIGSENGTPFIVSEFIEGPTLAEVLAAARPSYRRTAELVARLARALDYAHDQGIVHRDVKPGNVLIDAEGRPHISDFGLARGEEEDATLTLDGQILGTPAYMSPEQAAGRHDQVGPRSDVYSLGVVLYELLTGERPFRGSRSMLVFQVLNDEPRPPRKLNDHIPRDLETICLKAMAKEPSQRYGSAGDLSGDLHRYLAAEPIQARPVGVVERLWRWGRRQPALAGLSALVLVLLLAIIAGSVSAALWYERQAETERELRLTTLRQLAENHLQTAFKFADEGKSISSLPFLVECLKVAAEDPEREKMIRTRIATVLARCPRIIQMRFHSGAVVSGEFSADGRRVATASADRVVRVWSVDTGRALGPGIRHKKAVYQIHFSPEGERIITADASGHGHVWDWKTGKMLLPTLEHGKPVTDAVFSPDGQLILTACADGRAGVWDAQTGESVSWLEHEAAVKTAEFRFDGQRVVTASANGTIRVWDPRSGEKLLPDLVHPAPRGDVIATFSPDGKRILTASQDGNARIWDAETGKSTVEPVWHHFGVLHAAFSPDSTRVVSVGWSADRGRVWDAETGQDITPALAHGFSQHFACFSPDGRRVLTLAADWTARVWDAATGRQIGPSMPHGSAIETAAFGPDGHRILTLASDGVARVWDVSRAQPSTPGLVHKGGVLQVRFSPDGSALVTGDQSGRARVWDAVTGKALSNSFKHGGEVRHVEFTPDGQSLFSVSTDGRARIWRWDESRTPLTIQLGSPGTDGALSPSGRRLATVDTGGTVKLWDAGTGDPTGLEIRHRGGVRWVEFSPDERLLATAGNDGMARVHLVDSGEERCDPLSHRTSVYVATFRPGSRELLTADWEGNLTLWDLDRASAVRRFEGHQSSIRSAVFDAGGRRLATSSDDGTAIIWDVETGTRLTRRMHHGGSVYVVRFSPDELFLATASNDRSARIWDAATGAPVTPPLPHGEPLRSLDFSPDGLRLATAGLDPMVRIWDIPNETRPVEDLALLAQLLSSRTIADAGGLTILKPDRLKQIWTELSAKHPEEFKPDPQEIITWHSSVYCPAMLRQDWKTAIFHLDRILARVTDRWEFYNDRALAYRGLGQWLQAGRDGARAGALRLRELASTDRRGPSDPESGEHP